MARTWSEMLENPMRSSMLGGSWGISHTRSSSLSRLGASLGSVDRSRSWLLLGIGLCDASGDVGQVAAMSPCCWGISRTRSSSLSIGLC